MSNTINEAENAEKDNVHLLELTSDIVSAYVANNPIAKADLPEIITEVFSTISKISDQKNGLVNGKTNLQPAVPIKKSLHDDYIICLEDGKQFKSLKRHLNSQFGMSPDEYRQKWGLPSDYPMVAPNYAKARSRLAKEIGLGKKSGAVAA